MQNYNYSVSDIMLYNKKHDSDVANPISLLRKRRRELLDTNYDHVGEAFLIEQVRTIFLILRNLCYIR